MTVETFYFNPFRECTYLLSDDAGISILIDCGAYTEQERKRIEAYIRTKGLRLCAHLLTHGHLDHVFGTRFVKDTYGIGPLLHTADERLYNNLPHQAALFGIDCPEEPPTYSPLPTNETLRFGTLRVEVLHTPGHTPGSVCYRVTDESHPETEGLLLSGDTLFQGGYGRTDLPGGDYGSLQTSLRQLLQLPDITVLPGHGTPTRIAIERKRLGGVL